MPGTGEPEPSNIDTAMMQVKMLEEDANGQDIVVASTPLGLAARINTIECTAAPVAGDANAHGTAILGPIALTLGQQFKLMSLHVTGDKASGLRWGTKVGAFGALTDVGIAAKGTASFDYLVVTDEVPFFVYGPVAVAAVNIWLYAPATFEATATNNDATHTWEASLQAVVE